MLRINVLTTATPRTELHKKTLEPTLKVLSDHFDVHLYITLDDVLGKDAFSESLLHIATLESEGTTLLPSRSGSFKLAAKKLYEHIKDPDEDDLFFWLEDDWVLEKPEEFIEQLKQFPSSDYDFIVTTIYDKITGNPLIFRKRFFDHLQEYYLSNDPPMDPERVLWHTETKVWGTHNSNWLFLPDVFRDAGRDWRDERGIEKINKRSDVLTTWLFSE